MCHTANFARRTECFKCRAPYSGNTGSKIIDPCDELMLRQVPPNISDEAIIAAMCRSVHSETLSIDNIRIVAPLQKGPDGPLPTYGFVQFTTVEEAARVLNSCRGGRLTLEGGHIIRLSYSLKRLRDLSNAIAEAKFAPVYKTTEELKAILVSLYERYDTLTEQEKAFYDGNVSQLYSKAPTPKAAAVSPSVPITAVPVSIQSAREVNEIRARLHKAKLAKQQQEEERRQAEAAQKALEATSMPKWLGIPLPPCYKPLQCDAAGLVRAALNNIPLDVATRSCLSH